MEPEAGAERSYLIALPNKPLKLPVAGYRHATGRAQQKS